MSPSARREYLGALVLLAAGGVLGLVAASRPWGSARLESSLSVTSTTVSGSDLVPLAPAVALVALAAVVAIPAVRRLGRRIVGAVLVVLGVVQAVLAGLTLPDLAGRVQDWLDSSPEGLGSAEEITTSPGWAVAVVAAGLLVAAAGTLVAVRGPGWPGMGARYERPAGGEGAPARRPAEGNRATWDALDRGDDPT
ncbi:Trp biosynthesis-associated membrane protein [Jiangella mangrovi]|uniref:Putative membrane protein (TIGR02234 family) n=1 Tax=Jiangella mangrovi TaxID=1524084 RepID=A0A7W9GTX9_9ACTN|nr:Trp biosynthesis-associated membrane protein [Jiangella mangrovi]MBB5789691.1 putative membrane protein (TIGR02234 family) [Jiangella mangrovi]